MEDHTDRWSRNFIPGVVFITSVPHTYFPLATCVVADFFALFGLLTTGSL